MKLKFRCLIASLFDADMSRHEAFLRREMS